MSSPTTIKDSKLQLVPTGGSKTASFDGRGGGGDDGGMEHRLSEVEKAIVRLDSRSDLILSRLDSVNDRITDMAGRVSNFKWQILAAAVAIFLAVIGMGVAIQQMTVATFQAAAQASSEAKGSLTVQPAQPTIVVVPQGTQVAPPQPTTTPAPK